MNRCWRQTGPPQIPSPSFCSLGVSSRLPTTMCSPRCSVLARRCFPRWDYPAMWSSCGQPLASWLRRSSAMLSSAPHPPTPRLQSASGSQVRTAVVRRRAVDGESVDAAAPQHVGSTASIIGWTRQSSAAVPFTVWPGFLQHGCCGPHGGVNGRSQRLLRWQLSRISPGTTSISSSSTDVDNSAQVSRRRKVHSSP